MISTHPSKQSLETDRFHKRADRAAHLVMLRGRMVLGVAISWVALASCASSVPGFHCNLRSELCLLICVITQLQQHSSRMTACSSNPPKVDCQKPHNVGILSKLQGSQSGAACGCHHHAELCDQPTNGRQQKLGLRATCTAACFVSC